MKPWVTVHCASGILKAVARATDRTSTCTPRESLRRDLNRSGHVRMGCGAPTVRRLHTADVQHRPTIGL